MGSWRLELEIGEADLRTLIFAYADLHELNVLHVDMLMMQIAHVAVLMWGAVHVKLSEQDIKSLRCPYTFPNNLALCVLWHCCRLSFGNSL